MPWKSWRFFGEQTLLKQTMYLCINKRNRYPAVADQRPVGVHNCFNLLVTHKWKAWKCNFPFFMGIMSEDKPSYRPSNRRTWGFVREVTLPIFCSPYYSSFNSYSYSYILKASVTPFPFHPVIITNCFFENIFLINSP